MSSINYYSPDRLHEYWAWPCRFRAGRAFVRPDTSGQYLITGTSDANGLLYDGPISGVGGTAYPVNYPGATTTSVYGPDNLGNGELRLVGSYTTGNGIVQGFVFQGTTADLSNSSDYQTIDYPDATIHLRPQHDGRPRGRQRRRFRRRTARSARATRSSTASRRPTIS